MKFTLLLISSLLVVGCIFEMCSCVLGPSVKLADGSIVTTGVDVSGKSDDETSTAEVTTKAGDHILLAHHVAKKDNTEWTKYFTLYKLPVALGKQSLQAVRSNNAVKVATDKPTILTSTGADGGTAQSAVFNPSATSFFTATKR